MSRYVVHTMDICKHRLKCGKSRCNECYVKLTIMVTPDTLRRRRYNCPWCQSKHSDSKSQRCTADIKTLG
jgi:hypothetical protein